METKLRRVDYAGIAAVVTLLIGFILAYGDYRAAKAVSDKEVSELKDIVKGIPDMQARSIRLEEKLTIITGYYDEAIKRQSQRQP